MQKQNPTGTIVGHPITNPANFFGRTRQINHFFDLVLSERPLESRFIVGVRRSGKTSFLRYISNKHVIAEKSGARQQEAIIVYVNLEENINDPGDFYRNITAKIVESLTHNPQSFTPLLKDAPTFADFYTWTKIFLKTYRRLVILVDEFNLLIKSKNFELSFFRNLRSLVNERFMWVLSLKKIPEELSNVSHFKDKTSYFFNIFNPTITYIGLMEPAEAKELICNAAKTHQAVLDEAEIEQIADIAGYFPYFLQAVSERWFAAIKSGVSPAKRYETVMSELLNPDHQIHHQMKSYWLNLTPSEKKNLYQATQYQLDDSIANYSLTRLHNYGFVSKRDEKYKASSLLFEKWILKYSQYEQEPGAAQPKIRHHPSTTPGKKTKMVFISYSHQDAEWKDLLLRHLNVLVRKGLINIWHDNTIRPGTIWRDKLDQALNQTQVAILLISADFLASEFIQEVELPILRTRQAQGKTEIIPLLIKPVLLRLEPWLTSMQIRPKDDKALSSLLSFQQDEEFVLITQRVVEILGI